MSETMVQDRPEVTDAGVEKQEQALALLERYQSIVEGLEDTTTRLVAAFKEAGVDDATVASVTTSIAKQIELTGEVFRVNTEAEHVEAVAPVANEQQERKGVFGWLRTRTAGVIGAAALAGAIFWGINSDRDGSPEDTGDRQATEQTDGENEVDGLNGAQTRNVSNNETAEAGDDETETEASDADEETENTEETAETEPWQINYLEENEQRRWMENGSEIIRAQGELGTADEAFDEWISMVRQDPRAFAFTYNHIFHTDYSESDFVGEDGYVNELAVEKYNQLREALESVEFGEANANYYNTGFINGEFVVSQNPGISGERAAIIMTYEYETEEGTQVVQMDALGRCIQITVEKPEPTDPEGPTDEPEQPPEEPEEPPEEPEQPPEEPPEEEPEPELLKVCVPETGEIITVTPEEYEEGDFWDLDDLPDGIVIEDGRCVHAPADGPPPVAEQPPHEDTATETEGYPGRGHAEDIVEEQQGDPENLDETEHGTEAPDGSPGGGEDGVNEEITDETTQENEDHDEEVTEEFDGSDEGVSNDPESEEADTGEADEDTNTEDELDGGLPGATPGN